VRVRSVDVIFVRQTGVNKFQEDWLPILASVGLRTESKLLVMHRQRLTAALRAHGSTLRENHGRILAAMEPLQERLDRTPREAQKRWEEGHIALWVKVHTATQANTAMQWLKLLGEMANCKLSRIVFRGGS
jgi:hypothetical protein